MAGEDVSISINARGAAAASKGLLSTAQSAEKLQGSFGKLASASVALQSAFVPLLAIWAGVKAIQGFSSMIESATEAYNVQTKAAKGATDEQKKFASEMQQVLGVGDEVSLGLMRQARLLGVSESRMQDVTLAAIGLSAATGMGLEEALKKVNQAVRGNAGALAEVVPGLNNLTTEQQRLAAISDLVNRGLAEQRGNMTSLEGIQTRATNSIGDLMESFGALLAPIRAVVSYGFAVFAETMQSVLAPAVEMAGTMMGQLPAVFELVAKGVVGAITAVEVMITNLPEIVGAGLAQTELWFIQFTENVKHSLTVEIPAYASWFGDNWVNLIADAFMATYTIVKNVMLNIADTILALWDWVSSGFEGGANGLFARVGMSAGRSMLEGFEASTNMLPEIASRQITAREQQLSEQIGNVGQNIGQEFSDRFNERIEAVTDNFENFNTKVSLKQDTDAMDTGLGKASGASSLSAVESRLLTRGKVDDPNAKVVENTAKTVTEIKGLRDDVRAFGERPANVQMEVVGA